MKLTIITCVIGMYLMGCVQNITERTGKNLRVAASGKSLGGHQLGREGDRVFTGHFFLLNPGHVNVLPSKLAK